MSFLSSMLPMIAGGALAATGVGAPAAAALIGGLQYARTGSLNKGLMAGLGAYGGAGLGQGLLEAGAQSTANAAVPQGAALTEQGAAEVAKNTAGYGGMTTDEIRRQATQNYADKFMAAKDAAMQGGFTDNLSTMGKGLSAAVDNPSAFMSGSLGGGKQAAMYGLAAAAPAIMGTATPPPAPAGDSTMPQRLKYDQGVATPFPQPDVPGYDNLGQDFGRQRNYFPTAGYKQITPEEAKAIRGYAGGGLPVEQMSNANAVGQNTGYPQADIQGHAYATPWQTPVSENVVQGTADTGVNRMTGQMLATGGIADAHYNLGGYSDGGRLLRGPGDGVSDSIPATIGNKQPARLADGEFVVPARIVSELGNGSTEAGARKLYGMMDRVQSARGKTVGKGKVAKNTRADKYLPA